MTTTVNITHTTLADPALDSVNGIPPPGSILAVTYNAPHTMDPADVTAKLNPVTQSAQGLVPPPGPAGTGTYLGWNGSAFGWTTPPGTGAGTSDGVFQKLNLAPLLVAPDLGPGSFDDYDPWTLAGGTPGSNDVIVINTSALGATILGLVSTGRRGDILLIEVGGDGHGFLTIAHMSSATSQHKIYCPDGANVQVPHGGTVVLQCLNDTDHGWRFVAAGTGTRWNAGFPMDVTLPALTNNWNPWASSPARARRIRITVPSTGATITGIVASPDTLLNFNPGEIILLENYGDGANTSTATLTIKHYDSGSPTGSRVLTPGLLDVVVPIYGMQPVMFDLNSFDGNDWLILGSGKWV